MSEGAEGVVIHTSLGAPNWEVRPEDNPNWPPELALTYFMRRVQIRLSEAHIRANPRPWQLPGDGRGDPRQDGLCSQTDPELFYPELGDNAMTAKRLCGRCALQKECLEGAIARNETFGVWGGKNFSQSSKDYEKKLKRQRLKQLPGSAGTQAA